MRVLIDADMPAHELGHLTRETGKQDDEGNPIKELVPFKEIKDVAKGRFLSIAINSEAGGFSSYLTRGKTFRDRIATILPYKGNREGKDRDNVDLVKDLYHEEFGSKWCRGYEADDAMAMAQWDDLYDIGPKVDWDEDLMQEQAHTVIASRDKDMDTVPGWHFKWKLKDKNTPDSEVDKGEAYWVTVLQATRNFYVQILMGDAADNIAGLYNVGGKSAWVKQLDAMETEEEMYEHVLDKYTKYFRSYAYKFLTETARLLHLWRYKGDMWMPPHERPNDYWGYYDE